MKKVALFAFNGDAMCFIHVLLNALDLHERQVEGTMVLEGAATRLIPELAEGGSPLFQLYQKVRGLGLVAGVCRACANKMGTMEAAREQNLPLLDDMHGHPSMARFREAGFDIITF